MAWFVFQKIKYMCDTSEKKQFSAVEFPINETMEIYSSSKGLDDAQIVKARMTYSDNA